MYDAENQLVKALPKMAKKTESDELRSGIERHLEQTKEQVRRIEQIFEGMGESAKNKKCKGMQGIISEGNQTLREGYEGAVRDSAIIGSARRVEHYETPAYGTVFEFAELLGENQAVSLLAQSLEEEKETDRRLTEIAHTINEEARTSTGTGEEGEATARRRAKTAGA